MALPTFNEEGDLPPGVYRATLPEVLERFGQGSVQRCAVADRLSRLHQLAVSTGHVARFVVFGSFITAKAGPNDVDVILLMEDNFGMVQKKPISGNSTDPPRPGRNRPVDRVVDTLIPGERRVAQQLQPMPM
jgi:hypothetical protein